MVKSSNILLLASTKMRSRRWMTIISIIVSSFLFAILFAFGFLVFGLNKNIENLARETDSDKFSIAGRIKTPDDAFPISSNHSDIDAVRDFEVEYKKQTQEKYKELGIEYEDVVAPALIPSNNFADEHTPSKYRYAINYDSPVVDAYIANKITEYNKTAKNKLSDVQYLAKETEADKITAIRGYENVLSNSSSLIRNGKELPKISEAYGIGGYFSRGVRDSMYVSFYGDAANKFISDDTKELKGIPVIISAEEFQEVFGDDVGLAVKPSDKFQKLTWLNEARDKSRGFVYEICYRNSADLAIKSKFTTDLIDMEANKGNKDYIKPSLIYSEPKEACGEYEVADDSRSKEEKISEQLSIQNSKKLGEYQAPYRGKIKFQVVGLVSNDIFSYQSNPNIDSFASSLFGVSDYFQNGAVVLGDRIKFAPEDTREVFYNAEKMGSKYASDFDDIYSYYVLEYSSKDKAEDLFIRYLGCNGDSVCEKSGLEFSEFGRRFNLLGDFRDILIKFGFITFGLAFTVSVIIIWFIVSRTLSDSRKETAVYRSLGASRWTIFRIYFTYVSMLACLTVVLSIVLGLTGAYFVAKYYGISLYEDLSSVFGVVGKINSVDLLYVNWVYSISLVVAIFAVCYVAMLIPLIVNTRRDIISDIRD